MPRLSTSGSTAMGYGSVSVDGAPVAALSGIGAGILYGPAWLDSATIFYQNNGAGGFGPSISQSYDINTTALVTIDPDGCNQCCAGAGKWATWLAGRGVRTNIGGLGDIADVTFGDLSTDYGELALWTSPQTGRGVRVYDSSGVQLFDDAGVIIVGPPGVPFRLRGHLLVYNTSTGWIMRHVTGGAFGFAPRINESIGWITPVVTSAGAQLVLERSTRLTLRYAAKPNGWEIAPTGTVTENPDVLEVSPGVIRIAWSTNAGETADALVVVDLTLATGATSVGTVVGSTLVFTAGPTLSSQSFAVGPLQGRGGSVGALYPPIQAPVVDPATGLMTRPWTLYHQQVTTGLAATATAVASPSSPPSAPSFGVITAGGVPLTATTPGAPFIVTSSDGSLTFTVNPTTNTIDIVVT